MHTSADTLRVEVYETTAEYRVVSKTAGEEAAPFYQRTRLVEDQALVTRATRWILDGDVRLHGVVYMVYVVFASNVRCR
jgi:hypothetical protein